MIGITNVVNKRKSEAERVNLTLKTNQSEHTDLLGVNFTLTYGTYTKSYTWNGATITIEVPNGVEYTLTFPDVEGYACNTKSVTYTAQSGNSRMLEVLYQCELLTVSVSADNGIPSGFTISVMEGSSVISTQSALTGTHKIPFGVSYSVQASEVSGFETPSTYSGVADSPSKSVSMVYLEAGGTDSPTNGVWIQNVKGRYFTIDEWDGTQTPNGVAVITDSCRFVIALEDAYDSYCGWGGYGVLLNDIVQATDITTALLNYHGEQDTTAIINALKGTNDGYSDGAPAAEYCRAYIFPNGSIGYLGAAGEWQAALDNKAAINSALKLCGSVEMSEVYWTCTQYNKNESWYIRWHNEYFETSDRDLGCGVRAFASI